MARPCGGEKTAEYRKFLQQLVVNIQGKPASELAIDPHPPWLNTTEIPATVQTKATTENIAITLTQWQSLTPLQRFALIKLSRPGHENRNFMAAVQEFGLF